MTACDSVQHTKNFRFCKENRNIGIVPVVRICDSVVICTCVCSTDYLQVCNSWQTSLEDTLELDSNFNWFNPFGLIGFRFQNSIKLFMAELLQ